MTLLLYVEHLNRDRLEANLACVWPSTYLVARYLGCSESQVRANRRALEAAGYLVRDYTRAKPPGRRRGLRPASVDGAPGRVGGHR